MKEQDAVVLCNYSIWHNSGAVDCDGEVVAVLAPLGGAAAAAGCCTVLGSSTSRPAAEKRREVAAFLRKWADAIEPSNNTTRIPTAILMQFPRSQPPVPYR